MSRFIPRYFAVTVWDVGIEDRIYDIEFEVLEVVAVKCSIFGGCNDA
jgi:hypothetical protein